MNKLSIFIFQGDNQWWFTVLKLILLSTFMNSLVKFSDYSKSLTCELTVKSCRRYLFQSEELITHQMKFPISK